MNLNAFDPDLDELAPLVLHGLADDSQRANLAHLLSLSEENRGRFLDHAALHSQLAHAAKAGALCEDAGKFFEALESQKTVRPGRFLKLCLAAAAVLLACLIAIPLIPMTASAGLDLVIGSVRQFPDRTYRITVIEPASPEKPATKPDRGRFPADNHLEGATLWLREPGQFVLRQTLPEGEIRFLGSDGINSWSLRGKGPARVSSDPEQFGGGLVAKRRETAFLDLEGQLIGLKRLYDLEPLDRSDPALWKIRGIRKSSHQGGAGEIELWFTPDTGLLRRMILRQLPRENGGPKSIALELLDSSPLPADFFKPTHPHTASP